MDLFSALLLGLLQGLTEFLPVSSSGHLVLTQHLLGLKGSEQLAFDVLLHLATLLAVVIYFRRDIIRLSSSALTAADGEQGRRWLAMIVIGSIPTAVIGFTFEDAFRSLFGQPRFVSLMLWVTALILMLSDRRKIREETKNRLTVWRSLAVGTAQGLAIIPGVSRSGATITTAIFTGMDPELAARYSFLLSIPAIVGANMMEIKGIAGISANHLPAYAAGAIVAFLAGYLAIDVLLKVVVKRNLWKFSVYLFILGLIGLIFV